jgi:hypothetical protein
LAVVGSDIAFEQHLGQSRGIHLTPKPAPTFRIRIDPVPPRLLPGCTLYVEANHDDFGMRGRFSGPTFEAIVGPDGIADLKLPIAGDWQLQLSARRAGERRIVGPSFDLTPVADRTSVFAIDPDAFAVVRRR